MIHCSRCGAACPENSKFCPSCGAELLWRPDYGQNSGYDAQNDYDRDVRENRAMGILAYIGPLVFVPIFAAKNSSFARYHANQGLVLFLFWVAYHIAVNILSLVLVRFNPFSGILGMAWLIHLLDTLSIAFAVPMVIGIINASRGDMKPLPIIGGIRILR